MSPFCKLRQRSLYVSNGKHADASGVSTVFGVATAAARGLLARARPGPGSSLGAAGPDRPAWHNRAAVPVEPRGLGLGQRVLLRRRPGGYQELGRVLLRLAGRLQLHHGRQGARRAVGDGDLGASFWLQRLERAGAAGAGRGGDGRDRLSRRPPLVWAGRRTSRRRGGGAHAGRRPDVPVQQPGCARGAADHRGHLRNASRDRKWPDALVGAGRRADRGRIPGQGTAGLHHHPGPRRRVSPRRPSIARPTDRSSARRRGGRDRELGLVDRRGRADPERVAPLHRGIAEQRPDQLDLRIQRLRPAHRQRVGEYRRPRRSGLTMGVDRLEPPLQ